MKKELKDYLHFYLGCNMLFTGRDPFILDYYWLNHIAVKNSWEDYKPILRPISDMTEDEATECGNLDYDFSSEPDLNNWDWEDFYTLNSSNQFIYLLSKHFDIFGLIESGLAIDSTTFK